MTFMQQQLIYFFSFNFDNSFLLAIIAINLTLIGLTSLAETRTVLGVDYGKFLINKAYIFWKFKFKYFIILFASLNIVSTVLLFFTHYTVILFLTSVILLLAMVLLLIYFISSILFVNNRVSREIYISTLSCLYTSLNEDDRGHLYFDKALDIPDGSPTKKKVASDTYIFFNEFNFETQAVFNEIFGPDSFFYHPEKYKKEISFFAKQYDKENKRILTDEQINNPYKYRIIDGNYDITHEFFQLFRFTKLQAAWGINSYYLLTNGDENFISYSNIVRITCYFLLFCADPTIRTFKIINFLKDKYLENVRSPKIKEYEAHNTIKEIDFNHIEKIFLEAYFELCISALFNYIDNHHYKPLSEIYALIQKLIKEKTILKEVDKRKILSEQIDSLYENESRLAKKLDKKYFINLI